MAKQEPLSNTTLQIWRGVQQKRGEKVMQYYIVENGKKIDETNKLLERLLEEIIRLNEKVEKLEKGVEKNDKYDPPNLAGRST